MVNFGLKLQAHMVRGWEQYFVDYEALKRCVARCRYRCEDSVLRCVV